jgi:hypothetical protein
MVWKTRVVQQQTHMSRYLIRILMLRVFAFVLLAAFTVSFNQWQPLLGDDGLTPVNSFLDRLHPPRRQITGQTAYDVFDAFIDLLIDAGIPARALDPLQALHSRSRSRAPTLPIHVFKQAPTFLWFVPRGYVDVAVTAVSAAGIVLSLAVLCNGACSAVVMAFLWATYLSLVSVGQDWYGFGWESQLCETAFLFIFICPLSGARLPRHDMPLITTWLFRWLVFRIMIGAGFIKLRGDACWRDLTCMHYFYHTQPVPNPLAPYLHGMPGWFHQIEVLINHAVECFAPVFLLLPQPAAAVGGAIQIGFQVALIIAGNLSFLNWLTLVPAIAGLEDRHVAWLFSADTRDEVEEIQRENRQARGVSRVLLRIGVGWRFCVQLMLLVLVGSLSLPVVQNLLSTRQAMNTSFDWLRLVNTYGAFGSVTHERNEVIIEGQATNGTWYTYEFRCKPGDINRRPCVIAPYHHRIDWLMWFAAFSDPRRTGWLLQLANRMMVARTDPAAAKSFDSLLAVNPFAQPNKTADATTNSDKPLGPVAIRMSLYEYELNTAGVGGRRSMEGPGVEVGTWWRRRRLREYLPTVRPHDLERVAEFYRSKRSSEP